MIVVGLIILLLVVASTTVAVTEGGDPVRLSLHWFTIHTDGAALFVSGAVAVVLIVLALLLLRTGLRRWRGRRRELKQLRQRGAARSPSATGTPPPVKGSPAAQVGHPDADDYFDSAPRD